MNDMNKLVCSSVQLVRFFVQTDTESCVQVRISSKEGIDVYKHFLQQILKAAIVKLIVKDLSFEKNVMHL